MSQLLHTSPGSDVFLGVPLSSPTALPNSSNLLCPQWISKWIDEIQAREGLTSFVPLMASTDVRHGCGGRVCVVDPNRFPQGFNNVQVEDFKRGVEILMGDSNGMNRKKFLRGFKHVHLVEEDYASQPGLGSQHPYYRHLAKLQEFIRGVVEQINQKRATNNSASEQPAPITMSSSTRLKVGKMDSAKLSDFSTVVSKTLSEIGDLSPVSNGEVLNILNTSYPSDLEVKAQQVANQDDDAVSVSSSVSGCATQIHGGSSDISTTVEVDKFSETAANVSDSVYTCPLGSVTVDHRDPRLYNTVGKHELFSAIHHWLVEFQTRQREQALLDAVACEDDLESNNHAVNHTEVENSTGKSEDDDHQFQDPPPCFVASTLEMEARFDSFPGSIGDHMSKSRHMFCRLVGAKLTGSLDGIEPPWNKVFVKDDAGCNGVGLCVFSEKDLTSTSSTSGGGPQKSSNSGNSKATTKGNAISEMQNQSNATPCQQSPILNLTRAQKMALRGRNKHAKRRYVFQEGIPTTLLRYDKKTGKATAQLEIVLMFIDGRIFNYFVRQIMLTGGSDISDKEAGSMPENEDLCVSLNVPNVSFVQRIQFETDPEYRDAFLQVRSVWWKYEIAGRLAILALAKQAKQYRDGKQDARNFRSISQVSKSVLENNSLKAANTQNSGSNSVSNIGGKPLATVIPTTIQEESGEAFSRRLTGLLSKTFNQYPGKCSAVAMKRGRALIKDMQKIVQQSLTALSNSSAVDTDADVRKAIQTMVADMVSSIEQGADDGIIVIEQGLEKVKAICEVAA